MQGLADGYFVIPYTIGDYLARATPLAPLILIVTLFEEALNMKLSAPLDLVYLGASIALIALALYLTHASEHGISQGSASEKLLDGHPNQEKSADKHGH